MKNHVKCEPGRLGLTVVVNNDNFEKTLRIFKKKVMTDGILKEIRAREAFEKPSAKRRRLGKEAVRRRRKSDAIRLQIDMQ